MVAHACSPNYLYTEAENDTFEVSLSYIVQDLVTPLPLQQNKTKPKYLTSDSFSPISISQVILHLRPDAASWHHSKGVVTWLEPRIPRAVVLCKKLMLLMITWLSTVFSRLLGGRTWSGICRLWQGHLSPLTGACSKGGKVISESLEPFVSQLQDKHTAGL